MFWFLKKKNLKFTIISACLFLTGWAVCYFGLGRFLTGAESMNNLDTFDGGYSFFYFFIHNFSHCLLCIAGCGVLSSALLLFNGAVIGVSGVAYMAFGGSAATYFALILPHSVFEVPALIIAGAAGMKLLQLLIKYIGGNKEIPYKKEITDILKSLIIIAILLLIASIIEAYVTPIIAHHIGGTYG